MQGPAGEGGSTYLRLSTLNLAQPARARIHLPTTFWGTPTASAERFGSDRTGGVGKKGAARRVLQAPCRSTRILGVRRRHAPRYWKKEEKWRSAGELSAETIDGIVLGGYWHAGLAPSAACRLAVVGCGVVLAEAELAVAELNERLGAGSVALLHDYTGHYCIGRNYIGPTGSTTTGTTAAADPTRRLCWPRCRRRRGSSA